MNVQKQVWMKRRFRELKRKIDCGDGTRQDISEYVNLLYELFIPVSSDRRLKRSLAD